MKKRIVILTIAAAILAVTAGGVILVMSKNNSDNAGTRTWQEQYDLGIRYLSNGNYEEAIIAFAAAIEIDPRNPNLYIGRAEAYMGLGDTASARADYEMALEIDGTLADAWLGLAETYVAERDIERALEILQDAAGKTGDPRIKAKIEELESKLAPSHVHIWLDATCTEPKTCSECGITEGEALGHNMRPASYDAPATCSRCGHTESEPLIDNTSWTLENGVLTISGTGPMRDYNRDCAPWNDRRNEVTRAVIEDGVTTIGDNAFDWCRNLVSVTIPDSVTIIGEWSFYWCDSLINVTIPDSVTTIGCGAFWACNNFNSLTVPSGVTSIGEYAFNCELLEEINVDSGNDSYVSVDGVLFNEDMTLLLQYPSAKLGQYTIPTGVKRIGPCAFNGSHFTSITIPDSVTSIGSGAFSGCESLASVTIPFSVTEISREAFSICESLTAIYVDSGNQSYVSIDGVLFSADMELLHTYPTGKTESQYSIPTGVTTIAAKAFANCDKLINITIPDSVSWIEYDAFFGCENLASVTIPNGIEWISDGMFFGCRNLTNTIIPSSVTMIGVQAFANCNGLASVTIPNSVTSIGDGAFGCCDNLTSVTIPDGVTTIGYDAFEACHRLTDIYYGGTAEQWTVLAVDAGVPETTIIHYNYST